MRRLQSGSAAVRAPLTPRRPPPALWYASHGAYSVRVPQFFLILLLFPCQVNTSSLLIGIGSLPPRCCRMRHTGAGRAHASMRQRGMLWAAAAVCLLAAIGPAAAQQQLATAPRRRAVRPPRGAALVRCLQPARRPCLLPSPTSACIIDQNLICCRMLRCSPLRHRRGPARHRLALGPLRLVRPRHALRLSCRPMPTCRRCLGCGASAGTPLAGWRIGAQRGTAAARAPFPTTRLASMCATMAPRASLALVRACECGGDMNWGVQ